MTQDELKQAVAAISMCNGAIVGVGTGSTSNFFIEELGKSGPDRGAVASSQATAERLKLGIGAGAEQRE